MSFEHLFTNTPIAKEIEVAGVTDTYYFRKMTAGEQITLNKGQKKHDQVWRIHDGSGHFRLALA